MGQLGLAGRMLDVPHHACASGAAHGAPTSASPRFSNRKKLVPDKRAPFHLFSLFFRKGRGSNDVGNEVGKIDKMTVRC